MIARPIAIGTAALILTSAPVARAGDTFKAELTGDQEVPAVTDQGTTGKFVIEFNRDFSAGEYKLVVNKGIRVTQTHLHCGAAGANGSIIVYLAGNHPNGWDVDGQWVTNATVTNDNIVLKTTPCGDTLATIADDRPPPHGLRQRPFGGQAGRCRPRTARGRLAGRSKRQHRPCPWGRASDGPRLFPLSKLGIDLPGRRASRLGARRLDRRQPLDDRHHHARVHVPSPAASAACW